MNDKEQVWHLVAGAKDYGTLIESGNEMFWISCTFIPTENFSEIQSLFEEEQNLHKSLNQRTDEKALLRFNEIWKEIQARKLFLIAEDRDEIIQEFLLQIDGSQAKFRYPAVV
jgi:hypothetical protein